MLSSEQKNKIRDEFHEAWFVKSDVIPQFESILSWWLSKFDELQAEAKEELQD